MAHVSAAEVNSFIPEDRLQLATVDATKDTQQFGIIAGRLLNRYDISTWVDENTTPEQVRTILAMQIAGWIYLQSHAENTDEIDEYGRFLVSSAETLLGGLAEGTNTIENVTPTLVNEGLTFWPTDQATAIADSEGWDADGAAPRAFSMGKVF